MSEATSYQRLSPPLDRRECDVNALIADVVRAQGHEQVEFTTDLSEVPPIRRSGGGEAALAVVEARSSDAIALKAPAAVWAVLASQ